MMNMDVEHSGGQDFEMSSAIEDHMSKEDPGTEASKQDWIDLQTLRQKVRRWEESISCMNYSPQKRNRWSQVPRPRPRGRKGKRHINFLVPCKHQSEDAHDNEGVPRIQEDGQFGQRRQTLDQTI